MGDLLEVSCYWYVRPVFRENLLTKRFDLTEQNWFGQSYVLHCEGKSTYARTKIDVIVLHSSSYPLFFLHSRQ